MSIDLKSTDNFATRHIGPSPEETSEMLKVIGVDSLDSLIDQTVPKSIRMKGDLQIPEALSEYNYLKTLKEIASKNKLCKNYIGLGYYDTIVPSVIRRNILENPGWYTQYTPYQAEISQGRLEALLNFQTVVSDFTGMEIANASLLDEGTAAAEAMLLFYSEKNKRHDGAPHNKFLVSDQVYPQTLDVLRSRALAHEIELVVSDPSNFSFDETVFGVLVQYIGKDGEIYDFSEVAKKVHENGSYIAVAADLLSLALLTEPSALGADLVFGNSQRFGVPMGFGGPHAAFFATKTEFLRLIPGRLIGVSQDATGRPAYRMTLQTREQHIKREKATSNICTAQALLAIMGGMYAVWHGPEGIKNISMRVHTLARLLEAGFTEMGIKQVNKEYFDTLKIELGNISSAKVKEISEKKNINFYYPNETHVCISVDETTQPEDLQNVLSIFAEAKGSSAPTSDFQKQSGGVELTWNKNLIRISAYLTHQIFNGYQSETEMMRYIKKLENRDLSLTQSMIPLGSCTMKLNAATELYPVTWPEFSSVHPFQPLSQVDGYLEMIKGLENYLCAITGFAATSLQPNSGAQGEYAGLMVIMAYHRDHGGHRNVVLIPSSAHGTNPASAVAAGMDVVITKCDEKGNIDLDDLIRNADIHKDDLAGLMVTYPSTHGVFEEKIMEICKVIHERGGLVYMDGANMNAQVGLTSPSIIGADVCHINLHKTFSIPHGGGGPGMGPISVVEKLAPYLPSHTMTTTGGEKGIHAVSAAPWGSASILLISYAYIRLLGPKGCTDSTKYAILNANYLKARLEKHYPILYVGSNGRVAHEFIMDCRQFKSTTGIEVEDLAKRLMDYSFHAPTVSFPVPGTLMIEPTESEAKAELDRLCEALISIREEIREVEEGKMPKDDNVLKNAPHTLRELLSDSWAHSYSRQKAAYPVPVLKDHKFWTHVSRINNTFGDRNVVCVCPPIEAYA